ncbi:MAG: hypothetical protein ACYCWE_11900 [Eubacteriales bacterium]
MKTKRYNLVNKKSDKKSKIMPVLKYTAGITAAVGIATSGLIIYQSVKNHNTFNEEASLVVDAIKRKAEAAAKKADNIVKDIQYKNDIISQNIKSGFYNVSNDINKTVEDVSNNIF